MEATLRREVFDLTQIKATIARNPGRHGIAPLIEALDSVADEAPWTQSRLTAGSSTRRGEAFEADRVKDAKHHVAGYPVLRHTARRIDRDPTAVVAEIRAMLRRGSELLAASGR